jgi:hypothetical protein
LTSGPPSRRRRLGVAASIAALSAISLTVLHACTAVNGLIVPQKDAVAAPLDSGPVDPCEHARIPTQPAPEFDGAGVTAAFAISAVDFGSPDAGSRELGFDLDGTCSCFKLPDAGPDDPGQADTCVALGTSKNGRHCDSVGGRDNALALIANTTGTPIKFDDYITTILHDGRGGLLFRLSEYNGEANDARVVVGFYPSRGTYRDAGLGDVEHVDTTATNRWSFDPKYVALGVSTLHAEGWVRDSTLVVVLSGTSLPLVGLDLNLSDAYLVATLNRTDPQRPTIDHGVIVGRWDIRNLTDAVGRFVVALSPDSDGGRICEQPFIYDGVIKPGICATADIPANPKDDNKGIRCDALSIAMGFDAVRAELGDEMTIDTVAPCDDASTELVCP